MKKDLLFICYVVVSLLERQKRRTKTLMKGVDVADRQEYVDAGKAQIYDHSGDDGKEDPPVPIPNTEVKLFYAESTYG